MVLYRYMNNQMNKSVDKVLDVITALKDKAENGVPSEAKEGVDLVAIVKKLSRNREKTRSPKK